MLKGDKIVKKLAIYKCKVCGNVVVKLIDKGVPLMCCGQIMEKISPLAKDGATEKHMPVVEVNGQKVIVKVGEVEHPMTAEHYISHIIALTDKGFMVKKLSPNDKPQAEFVLTDNEHAQAVYSYCNLHGLWVIDNF